MPLSRTHCSLCKATGHPAYKCRDEFFPATDELRMALPLMPHLPDWTPYDPQADQAQLLLGPAPTLPRHQVLPAIGDAESSPLWMLSLLLLLAE